MPFLLHGLTLAAAAWAMLALLYIRSRTKAYGKRALFARKAGSTNAGAFYAFTKAMLPWAKESVRENLPSYAMGMAYHAGIFTAFAFLVIEIIGYRSHVPDIFHYPVLLLLGVGALGGLSLFMKRLVNPVLRGISSPDDYISNALATIFVGHALAAMSLECICVIQAWLISAIVLFVYIPIGKIRHCIFFFSTRYHMGAFFGRRGCMPPSE